MYFLNKEVNLLIIKIGNIFESKATTLVNTVNCVGVMGKGIALDFKKRFPNMYEEYVMLCENGSVRPGKPYVYQDMYGPSILNFPTKDHWRSPSKLSYIISGLSWFRDHFQEYGITSIAFPPLGCGNGGLTWDVVGPVMYDNLKDLPIDIEIYAPFGTPQEQLTISYLEKNIVHSTQEVLGTKNMQLNKYWLLILYVVQKLNHDKYSLNVGRTIFQKICYILTRIGLPTGFVFIESSYGPYAKEVKNAITVLSNANLMIERKLGRMVETIVNPSFVLPTEMFTDEELRLADCAFDLLSRVKSTDQAEMIATVLFSYDTISKKEQPTEQDVYKHVMKWKPHWREQKDAEVQAAICDLSSLRWMYPRQDIGLLDTENLF